MKKSAIWDAAVPAAVQAGPRPRFRRCDSGYASRSLRRLERLPISVDTETDTHAWGRTRDISMDYDLTLYDAAHLELALRRKLPFASHDSALIDAGRRAPPGGARG